MKTITVVTIIIELPWNPEHVWITECEKFVFSDTKMYKWIFTAIEKVFKNDNTRTHFKQNGP